MLAPKGPNATGQDQDDTIMMPWTTAMQRIVGKDQSPGSTTSCARPRSTDGDRGSRPTQIAALLRQRHHIQPGADDDFNIRHPEELAEGAHQVSKHARARCCSCSP